MRFASFAVVALVGWLALAAAPARAEEPARFVAQLAGADAAPRATPSRRAAAPDAAAIARATPRLAALGLRVTRALLDGLPAPSAAARAGMDATPAPAFERIVLIEAADSAAADTAREALVRSGVAEWAEPLLVRAIADAPLAAGTGGAAPRARATLDSLPNDSMLRDSHQWGLYNVGAAGGAIYGGVARADVHAPEAWRLCVGADALKLAIADTGIDPDQPELGGWLRDGSPRIVDALNVTGEPVPAVTDSFGHGTPVTGVIAARTNDGPHFSGRGIAGVCGGDGFTTAGCRIVPIKISAGHSGEANSFDIAAAILHATDCGARAMNLSYAGPGSSRVERLALGHAITHGCVVVAAAGNNGARAVPDQAMYPAAHAAEGLCIQVGASDWNDQRTGFSSYGPGLDLVAPGTNIWTTFMTYPSYYGATYDGYVAAAGTSYAAPFVTGAVGLLAAARPGLDDDDFQHVLRETADDIGDPGPDAKTGWGRLDLARALAAVGPGAGLWHDEVAADAIAPDTLSAQLSIGERGPGTLDRWTGSVPARRWAATATVTLPDSFTDSVRVWVRVGGTMAARGDWILPYFTPSAQVIARTARTFTLRGYVYRAEADSCDACPETWIPLPPDYVRFAFTVLGPVRPAAARAPAAAGGAPPRLVAAPNPFRAELCVRAPGAGRVTVLDAAGRTWRTFAAAAGEARWDGRDGAGRIAPPGLYFVRWTAGGETRATRVVKLAP